VNGLSDPGTEKGRLQRACLEVLREHEAAGALPTSVRFLWYELVQRGVVDKTKSRGHAGVRKGVDQYVAEALMHLRENRLVPWAWIVDETRHAYRYAGHRTIRDGAQAALEAVRLDPWDGTPPPVVVCESRSLAGVLDVVADDYRCSITSTNGQAGGFLRTNVAPLFDGGRPALYVGDLDLSAGQIEANTRRVLDGSCTSWRRVALTDAQADEHGLEQLAVEKEDRRYRPAKTHRAIETEALSQQVIVEILRGELDSMLPEPLADVLVREEQQRTDIRSLLEG
jgi:hypothetical protein